MSVTKCIYRFPGPCLFLSRNLFIIVTIIPLFLVTFQAITTTLISSKSKTPIPGVVYAFLRREFHPPQSRGGDSGSGGHPPFFPESRRVLLESYDTDDNKDVPIDELIDTIDSIVNRVQMKTKEEEFPRQQQHHQHHQQQQQPQSQQPASPQRATKEGVAPDHEVLSLPLLPDGLFRTKHYAGHLSAAAPETGKQDNEDRMIFYWLFEPDDGKDDSGDGGDDGNRNKDKEHPPLVIWLNGGPACSSMDGLFLETGPFRLRRRTDGADSSSPWEIGINPNSWHRSPAYVAYVDQPVGTGLSYDLKKNWAKNEDEVNYDFYNFLVRLLNTYDDLFLETIIGDDGDGQEVKARKTKVPIFFAGESYAGRYIPSMMRYILERNDIIAEGGNKQHTSSSSIDIMLGGAAIGNGWIDPPNQYAATETAYYSGLVDDAQRSDLDAKEERCRSAINSMKTMTSVDGRNRREGKAPNICLELLDEITNDSTGEGSNVTISPYDYRMFESKSDESRSFPPGHKVVESYLGGWTSADGRAYPSDMGTNRQEVLSAIHATGSIAAKQRYLECTDDAFYALQHDGTNGAIYDIERVLDYGRDDYSHKLYGSSPPLIPRILFYNGMNDLICNQFGVEKSLDGLDWHGSDVWALPSCERYIWFPPIIDSENDNSRHPGYLKVHGNLAYLRITNSGHMVPMDRPRTALQMMRAFLHSTDWKGFTSKSYKQNLVQSSFIQDIKKEENNASCQRCPKCNIVKDNTGEDRTTGYMTEGTKCDENGGFWRKHDVKSTKESVKDVKGEPVKEVKSQKDDEVDVPSGERTEAVALWLYIIVTVALVAFFGYRRLFPRVNHFDREKSSIELSSVYSDTHQELFKDEPLQH